MELMEAIAGRRSVRRFREEAIPREVLEELLTAACWAPSAENTQPWYFLALTGSEDIQELQTTMEQVSEQMRPYLEEAFPGQPRVVARTTSFLRHLGGAPVYVLVFLQEDCAAHARDSMIESAAAAIQNLLLSAHDHGLGACWVNAATALGYGPALRERFAPDKGEFVSMISLGYPDRWAVAPPRKPGRWEIR